MSNAQAQENSSGSVGLMTMSPSVVKDRLSRAEQTHNNSILATSLYISKAIIGAGMLSLPVALDAAGWYLGVIMLIMFACLSQMTCHYLAVVINNFREFTIPRNPLMTFRDEKLYIEAGQNEVQNEAANGIVSEITKENNNENVDNNVDNSSAQLSSQIVQAESSRIAARNSSSLQPIGHQTSAKVQNSQFVIRENSQEWSKTRSQNIANVESVGEVASNDAAEAIDVQHEREKWQVDPKNLSEILLPKHFTWLLDLVIFLQTWPSAIPYFQIVGDAASSVIVYNLNAPDEDKSMWRAIIIIIAACAWFPFLLMVSIVEIGKYTNLVGICGLLYCAILAMAMANFKWDSFPQLEDVTLDSGDVERQTVTLPVIHNDAPQSAVDFLAKVEEKFLKENFRVPTFAFAYGCQFCLFISYNEMGKNASVKSATLASGGGNLIASVFYLASMVCMYATFGHNINGSFMDQLHNTFESNGWVVTGQVLLFLAVSTGLPIYLHAGRNAFMSLIQVRAATFEPARKTVVGWGCLKMPAWLWRGSVSLLLTVVAVILAIVITDLSSVLGILGIIASTPVVFIVPSYFYLRCYYKKWAAITEQRMWEKYGVAGTEKPKDLVALWDEPKWKIWLAWVIFTMGIIIILACLIGTSLYLATVECVICHK